MNELIKAAKAMVEWFDSITAEEAPIENLRAAVDRAEKQEAEPEDKPFCYVTLGTDHDYQMYRDRKQAMDDGIEKVEPLYRHPPHQMARLTDDEIKQVIRQTIPDTTVSEMVTFRAIARAIERALLEKNKCKS